MAQQEEQASEQLKVIGAGFGRTGTDSLKLALNQLGYKCYHMHELFKHDDTAVWDEILSQPKSERNWNESLFKLRGYTATVDWPTTHFYADLLKENPSAKVVLTIRDSPEQWFKSVEGSIWQFTVLRDSWQMRFVGRFIDIMSRGKIADDVVWKGLFDGKFDDKERSIGIYNDHIESVKQVVPPDQLLIMNVKQGWEPLCKFLGKDVPDTPFPRGNTTKDKLKALEGMRNMKYAVNVLAMVGAAAVAVGGYKYYQKFKK